MASLFTNGMKRITSSTVVMPSRIVSTRLRWNVGIPPVIGPGSRSRPWATGAFPGEVCVDSHKWDGRGPAERLWGLPFLETRLEMSEPSAIKAAGSGGVRKRALATERTTRAAPEWSRLIGRSVASTGGPGGAGLGLPALQLIHETVQR